MARSIAIRHGKTVGHFGSAADAADFALRLTAGDSIVVDSCIARVGKTCLEMVEKKLGQTYSGLGKTIGPLRNVSDPLASKTANALNEAMGLVRHLTELGETAFVEKFRVALDSPPKRRLHPLQCNASDPMPVKNTFIHFDGHVNNDDPNDSTDTAATAPPRFDTHSLPSDSEAARAEETAEPNATLLFNIFDARVEASTQTEHYPGHAEFDIGGDQSSVNDEPPLAPLDVVQSSLVAESGPADVMPDPWQHGDDPWSKAACAGRKPGQHGNSLNPDAQLCLRSTSFGIGAATLEKTDGPLPLRTKLFINNEWVDCSGGRLLTPFALGQRRFSPRCRRRATRM